jgi:5-(carboxyamino)imidazole ribonucleotide synthase
MQYNIIHSHRFLAPDAAVSDVSATSGISNAAMFSTFKYTGLYDEKTLIQINSQSKDAMPRILGVLGGGQLGRMFAQAAQRMGFEVCVFCPEAKADSPAAMLAEHHIQADFNNYSALDVFAKLVDAATTEFENIPYICFEYLAALNLPVAPDAMALKTAQHRILEKNFLKDSGVPVTDFLEIQHLQDLIDAPEAMFPAILKTVTQGYDGKGQFVVQNKKEALDLFDAQYIYILEKRVNLSHEISVIISRGFDGKMAVFPIPQNQHHQGILMASQVPSPDTPQHLIDAATAYAQKIAIALNYHGVLCVEFFVTQESELLANEIAPRPHNSGHFTQDACASSQFDHQASVLAKFNLPNTDLLAPALMINILGQAWGFAKQEDEEIANTWQHMIEANMHLHLYGKKEPKIGRKMGHINCLFDAKNSQNLEEKIKITKNKLIKKLWGI